MVWKNTIYMRILFKNAMKFTGTVGKIQTRASITGKRLVLEQKNEKVFDNNLWLVCFQRVSPRLKMCDVIFVHADSVWQMSIERSLVDDITENANVPVVQAGLDPLPWKKFAADAKQYGWQPEDWLHLFEDESLSDESDAESADEDWVPEDDDESEDEDWDPDDED